MKYFIMYIYIYNIKMQGKSVYVGLLIFVLLDLTFLYSNQRLFANQIIDVQRVTMIAKPVPFVATYVILCFAFWYFVLRTKRPVWEAALLGFVLHSVYELTNYTTFKKWRFGTVLLDSLWGATLWGGSAYLTYSIFSRD